MALLALTENLRSTSGDNFVAKLTSYIVFDKHVTSGASSSASSGTEESHLASATHVVNHVEGVKNHAGDMADSILKAIPKRRLKRSVSDLALPSGLQHEPKTAVVALNAFRSKDDMYHSQHAVSFLSHAFLQPSRTQRGRPVVTPRNELKSGEYKTAKLTVSFQRDSKPDGPCRRSTENKIFIRKGPVSTRYTVLRSSSDSYLARASTTPQLHGRDPTLKSCTKKRPKSDTSMLPNALQRGTNGVGSKALPRIKTVSFKRNNRNSRKSSHLAHKVTSISNSSAESMTHDGNAHHSRVNKQRTMIRDILLFANAMWAVKSNVADPAITRTDVHVIAISPSWDARDVVNEEGSDLATPTMQTIEIGTGSYEVVWDDVPPEQHIGVRARRSSSASHSFGIVNFGARYGLERVDKKLAGCSRTWNSASNSSTPTIAVFPDDGGRATSFECTIEDLPLPVPPNSQVTSVTSSRHASRPGSRSLTRTASSEDMLPGVFVNGRHQHAAQDLPQPSEKSLFAHRPKLQRKERKKRCPETVRQLSSLDEADSHFCGHRDSVALSHARLIRSKRAFPEPSERQDSYMIAKKRMNTGDGDMPEDSASSSSKDLLIEIDNGIPEVSLPVVKEHVVHALKNIIPVSILRKSQCPNDQ